MKLLRLPEVKRKTTMKKSTIYKKIKQGLFPPPIKLGPRISVWIESDVDEILAAYTKTQDENYIKKIVFSIKNKRQKAPETLE